MINIIQQPQPINYSLSIPDLILQTDQPYIYVEISDSVSGLEVTERYDAAPAGGNNRIRLSELLDSACRATLPNGSDIIQAFPDAVNTVQVKYKDAEGTIWNALSFKVIKGFAHPQEFDISNFFITHWLTPMPKYSQVYYHQPLFLSVYHPQVLEVMVAARMEDESTKTISLGNLSADVLQTINLNPGRMIAELEGEYKYFEVYTRDSANIIRHQPYRFYSLGTYRHQADVFVYLNRLGGFDTLVMNGERKDKYSTQDKLANLEKRDIAYHQQHSFSIEKNSGYISTRELRRQHVDFAQSSQRYYLHEGKLIPITIESMDLGFAQGKSNEYTFTFKPAQTDILRPELGFNTYYLDI